MKNILLIEDKDYLLSYLKSKAKEKNYAVAQINNSKAAIIKAFKGRIYDLVILDSTNIVELCNQIKQINNIPIIAFYNHNEQKPICNADECVMKPLNVSQLLYIIQKYTEKSLTDAKYTFKDIVLDNDKCEVTFKGRLLELSKKEYNVLALLIKNKNNVLSRDELLNNVWGIDYLGETNVIDICIKHLRDKLSKYSETEYIKTVRGIGYACCE